MDRKLLDWKFRFLPLAAFVVAAGAWFLWPEAKPALTWEQEFARPVLMANGRSGVTTVGPKDASLSAQDEQKALSWAVKAAVEIYTVTDKPRRHFTAGIRGLLTPEGAAGIGAALERARMIETMEQFHATMRSRLRGDALMLASSVKDGRVAWVAMVPVTTEHKSDSGTRTEQSDIQLVMSAASPAAEPKIVQMIVMTR